MLPLARVPGVTPRPLIAALAIALAAIASGCATFPDSNTVARVGDETLSNDELREIVARVGSRATLEASGGITLENVRAVAETGGERISIGALTHSAPGADVALEIRPGESRPGSVGA